MGMITDVALRIIREGRGNNYDVDSIYCAVESTDSITLRFQQVRF